uniref:Uncharacterized protein n=1 Tax=Chenopodium quinoa TaxID=63459 RepID=A0A803MPA7_CHEQI
MPCGLLFGFEIVNRFYRGILRLSCGFSCDTEKVEQVAEEAYSLKESLDKYFMRNQRRMQEAKERAELLGGANGESSHVLRIFDDEARAMQSAHNSSRMLEDAYSTGVAILSKFAEQRESMKGKYDNFGIVREGSSFGDQLDDLMVFVAGVE